MARFEHPTTVGDPPIRVHEGRFVWVLLDGPAPAGLAAVASVLEGEGPSLVISRPDAERAGLPHGEALAWIECIYATPGTRSRRPGVLVGALAAAGLGCHVVAGARAEHLFVAEADLPAVLALLSTRGDEEATGRDVPSPPRTVAIREGTIRLGQFLKLAGLVGSGSDVKPLLDFELVAVNGEPERRRGRQLRRGDVVSLDGVEVAVG